MLASTALVACTNEDDVVNNEQAVANGEKSYVAVNIVTPGSVSGRATFEAGSDDEVKVENATFLFLNGSLEGCADPYTVKNLNFTDATGQGQDKEATVLVIENNREVPAYIVAILNPVGTYTAQTSLADLKAEHATYTTYTNKNFVMSNAVYKAANGKEVAATPITLDYIFSTGDEALANPVTVQVERVVGKVAVDLNTAAEDWTMGDEQLDDAEDKKLSLVITGWDILQNVESTLVKNVDLSWNHTWWNDVILMRSYWAKDYTTAGRTKILVDEMKAPEYRYVEETVSQNANTVEVNNVNPYLVVAGEFVDEDGNKVELVEWRGRKYTMEGYLKFIAGNSNVAQYWTKSGDTYTSFSYDLLQLVDDTDNTTHYKSIATLKNPDTEFYTCDYDAAGEPVEGSWEKAAEGVVEAAIADFGAVQYWNDGRTYYYTPITHQTVGTDNYYGVVRNHVYKVTISAISGFGTPVANPQQAIEIPEKPVDDASYLAAKVVILDWRVVENEVTLE